ncbi:MAG: hypothetical protein AB1629_08355 [Candidatus Omnitrophota bacterium]
MEKNYIAKIIRFIKHKILRLSIKIKDPKTGIVYIVAESDMDKCFNRGVRYWRQKKYDKAIESIKKGIKFDRGDYLGYWYLGQIYIEMGDLKEGKRNYEIAIKNGQQRYSEHPELMQTTIIDDIKKEYEQIKNR